ncbi:MAG: hypothetical protein ACAH27_20125 [Xanthobacteraceae bacterium]
MVEYDQIGGIARIINTARKHGTAQIRNIRRGNGTDRTSAGAPTRLLTH